MGLVKEYALHKQNLNWYQKQFMNHIISVQYHYLSILDKILIFLQYEHGWGGSKVNIFPS